MLEVSSHNSQENFSSYYPLTSSYTKERRIWKEYFMMGHPAQTYLFNHSFKNDLFSITLMPVILQNVGNIIENKTWSQTFNNIQSSECF
jgi:hypothetical protein